MDQDATMPYNLNPKPLIEAWAAERALLNARTAEIQSALGEETQVHPGEPIFLSFSDNEFYFTNSFCQ